MKIYLAHIAGEKGQKMTLEKLNYLNQLISFYVLFPLSDKQELVRDYKLKKENDYDESSS